MSGANSLFQHLELELKFRLADGSAQAALCQALGVNPGPSIEQLNHFFDTPEGELARAHYTLRLREEIGHGFLFTAKGPERRSADGLLTEKLEREATVPASTAQALLAGSVAPLAVLSELLGADCNVCLAMARASAGKVISHVGSFANLRTPLKIEVEAAGARWPVVFELDRTTFPGDRIDYELEVELRGVRTLAERDSLASAIRALVLRAGIAPEPMPSKAKRFFAITRAMRSG